MCLSGAATALDIQTAAKAIVEQAKPKLCWPQPQRKKWRDSLPNAVSSISIKLLGMTCCCQYHMRQSNADAITALGVLFACKTATDFELGTAGQTG